MENKIFTFKHENKGNWSSNRDQINYTLTDLIRKSSYGNFDKDFEVEFREIKKVKTSAQLRGIHKLCTILIPYLSEDSKKKFDLKKVKDEIKLELGYMRNPNEYEIQFMLKSGGIKLYELTEKEAEKALNFVNRIKQPKSFADATKEEMIELITGIEVYATERGYEGVFLTSHEKQEMLKFYENRK